MKNLILIIATLFNFSLVAQIRPVSTVVIPKQTGNAGKYLKTNGSTMSWDNVTAGLTASLTPNYIPYAVSSSSLSNSTIQTYTNGITNFNSALDGEGSGISNITYSTSVGGLRHSFHGQSGYGTLFDYYTNGVKNSEVQEFSGYMAVKVKNFWSVRNYNTGNSHLFVDMSTGYTGIGGNGFSPGARLDVDGNIHCRSSFYADNILTYSSASLSFSSAADMIFKLNGTEYFRFKSGGSFGIGEASPTAKLHILQNTTSTSAKALSVNTGSGELLSIDDNTYTNFYGLGFNVNGYGGNANMNLVSTSGAYDPTLTFKYNGGSTSGTISGSSSSLWIRPTGNLLISQTYTNPTSIIQAVGLLEYADNAAAISAGLTVGAFYRTGDDLKVVH